MGFCAQRTTFCTQCRSRRPHGRRPISAREHPRCNGCGGDRTKSASIISDNTSRVQDLQSKPILKMGDDPQRVASLEDLRNFEQLMRTRAASDEATDMN